MIYTLLLNQLCSQTTQIFSFLFQTMIKELFVIQYWFNTNKLSLNATETKYSFFHYLSYVDKISLRLPELKTSSNTDIH